MRINKITQNCVYDFGVAVEVHFQGCPHKCVGCYAPKTWPKQAGTDMDVMEVAQEVKRLQHDGVVLIGGDPLYQPRECVKLIKYLRRNGEKLIWLYTGYDEHEIDKSPVRKLAFQLCDVVITGRFDIKKKCQGLLGSSNQKIWLNNVVWKDKVQAYLGSIKQFDDLMMKQNSNRGKK